MLDTGNNFRKIIRGITTIAVGALLIVACLSKTYNTISIIGLCTSFFMLCLIGLFFRSTAVQRLRPLILLVSLVCFGFILNGCSCILFHFQGFILFLFGKTYFWVSFTVVAIILVLTVVFGAIWCGWICMLGALQEFIFKQNKWFFLKTRKARKIVFTIQMILFALFVMWISVVKYPVLCSYDPFISIFRLKIFNWLGYITVPLLLVSSLFIYRPFCRIICPIGFLISLLNNFSFTSKLKIYECTNCKKCHTHCRINAIQEKKINNGCIMCGECKKANCKSLIL